MLASMIRARRIGLAGAPAAAGGLLALAGCSSSSGHQASGGGTAKSVAATASASPAPSVWDLPQSDRPPVPGEACTMTYAPTGRSVHS